MINIGAGRFRKFTIVLLCCIFMIIVTINAMIYLFTLHLWVASKPTSSAPPPKDQYIFVWPIDMRPNIPLTVTFQDIEIYDTTAQTELHPAVWVYDLEGQSALYSGGFFTANDIREIYSTNLKRAENLKLKSEWMCVLLLFKELPPPNHAIQVVVSYKLFGVIQKSETVWLDNNYVIE